MTDEIDADRRSRFHDVPDGCGCVEVWEVLAERRSEISSETVGSEDDRTGAREDGSEDRTLVEE